ncbi:type II secretion system minor pseudopilin GspH [Celerinatantimonas sp. YJH-8]|uniref:type II secretion system minor pseudopilin GspH n=1 Tax=Celerinatantimonas sp. YJH-8 TaxID=3228714 RepID=UPI0038C0561D
MHSQRGFTLLELLLVIALIGIGSSVVIYSMGPNSTQQASEQKVRFLAEQLRFARDQAVLNQQPLGLNLTDNGYRFYDYRNQRWQLLQGHFQPVHGPLQLSLQIDGKAIDLTPPKPTKRIAEGDGTGMLKSEVKHPPMPPMQLFFNGDGIWPDFQLSVVIQGVRWMIAVDDRQQLVVERGLAS